MNSQNKDDHKIFDARVNADSVLQEKLDDGMTLRIAIEFDPDEAERLGAFVEDALSEHDAVASEGYVAGMFDGER